MPSHAAGREIKPDEAHELLIRGSVVGVKEHPACIDFELADGRTVALYEGDRDNSREWVIEGEHA